MAGSHVEVDRRAGPTGEWVVEEATFSLYAISDALQRGAVNQIKSNSVRNLFREIGG
jgi:hypothetical protein